MYSERAYRTLKEGPVHAMEAEERTFGLPLSNKKLVDVIVSLS
jgi:hypothetical protein